MARTQPLAVTMSKDHKLRILSMPGGEERRSIDVGARAIDVIALSANGESVVIGDHKGAVSVWSTSTGESRLQFTLHHYPGLAAFSNNGTLLATAAQGDPLQVIDVATGKPVATLGSPVGGTLAAAFSPDDRWIATGDGDAGIRVYDVQTGRQTAENHDLLMVPLTVAFTADGSTVIAGSGDKTLLFVATASGRMTKRLERTIQPVSLVDVSPDGAVFTSVFMKSEDMTQPDHIVIQAMDSGARQVDWLPPTMPVGGGWMKEGQMLVALSSPEALRLWRLR